MRNDICLLNSLRQRLLSVRIPLQEPINEQDGFVHTKSQKLFVESRQASLKPINSDLEHVDQQSDVLTEQDEQMNQLFNLITSMPGIEVITTTSV